MPARIYSKSYWLITQTGAVIVITTDWKAVNGWDFWKYISSDTGKIKKIGFLKIVR
jgi:hypothetical protein